MSMLLKVICGTMFLLGMSWNIMAKGVIKGRVVDSQSKEVLVGATVNVEGTTVGCATDAEGYFENISSWRYSRRKWCKKIKRRIA